MPLSKGGRDTWENVVSACFHCNSRKGGRTPQQAGMPLLAVPFRPSWIEHLILSNRHILADQMAFLKSHLPKRARSIALWYSEWVHRKVAPNPPIRVACGFLINSRITLRSRLISIRGSNSRTSA